MARSRAARVSSAEAEFAEIIAWYEDLLERSSPPVGLRWEPVRLGPTWRYEDRWLLPDFTLGWRVLAWCGVWLRDKHGKPWQFTAEQARFVLWYFAIDPETGDFLYHSAVLQRLKGWGKDPIAAALSVAAMFAEVTFDHWDGDRPVGREEPNAWIQIVAVSLDQTKNTMKLFPGLISAEARRHYAIQVGKRNVWGLSDTRQIEAVTASPLAIEGGRPTLIVRNETQNWILGNGGHEMAGAIEGNAAKSEDGAARLLDICNAYRPGQDSVGERVREGWESTQGRRCERHTGQIEWPACEDCEKPQTRDFGLMYDSLEAPPDAPLNVETAPGVIDSIRGDASWLSMKRIVASILNPANSASESRRKWYNQITATEDSWADAKYWDPCAAPGQLVLPDEPIVAFFDGSKSDDATGLVGCRLSDGHVFTIGVWQRPPKDRAIKGWIVDRDAVDEAVAAMFGLYKVKAFFGDPSDVRDDEGERFWEPMLDDWHRRYGPQLEMWAVQSGDNRHAIAWDMRSPERQRTFTAAAEQFVSEMEAGPARLTHDGSRVLRAHVLNAKRRTGSFGVGLGKEHRESARKIDLAVCAVGARMLRRMYLNKNAGTKQRSGKVW